MTSIEWTERTWNPVRGCTKISPGCKNCYASTFAERFRGVAGHPYEQGFDLRLVPEKLREPLSWKRPAMCFVNSMSDLFQAGVPFEFVDQVFAVMALTPRHTYQVLTKRPERMREYCTRSVGRDGVTHMAATRGSGFQIEREMRIREAAPQYLSFASYPTEPVTFPLPNVWLGVSVENQKYADERIPLLLETPAAVRFISAEPLLGPIDLTPESPDTMPAVSMLRGADWCDPAIPGLDWVICGGESGPGARPMSLSWATSLLEQCYHAGVPFFMKQLGAHPVMSDTMLPWKTAMRDRKGGDPAEWPGHLRVREFPKARPA